MNNTRYLINQSAPFLHIFCVRFQVSTSFLTHDPSVNEDVTDHFLFTCYWNYHFNPDFLFWFFNEWIQHKWMETHLRQEFLHALGYYHPDSVINSVLFSFPVNFPLPLHSWLWNCEFTTKKCFYFISKFNR